MNPGNDEARWRKRLLAYSAVRLGGIVIVFLGVAIIYTNLLREGGWPRLGAVVAIMGAVDALFAPRLLKRGWDAAAVDRPGDGRTDAQDRQDK